MTAEDALLASVMRKLLQDSAAYVDVCAGEPGDDPYVQIDGDAMVTAEEARACATVREQWRQARHTPPEDIS